MMDIYIRILLVGLLHQTIVESHPERDALYGVVDILVDQHKVGGTYVPEVTTYFECLERCRESEDCLAADFEESVSACWFHDHQSACSPPKPQQGVKHIKLCDCTPGVSVGGGRLISDYVEQSMCIKACKNSRNCYGVDYNIRSQHCYHHYMDTICQDKLADPDAVHFTQVNCRSSPSALKMESSKFVRGGTIKSDVFSEGDCTSACLDDDVCAGVDYYHSNHTCVMHNADTECDPRFPLDGVTHFQFDSCGAYPTAVTASFGGLVLDADDQIVGTESTLAIDEFGCISLCDLTPGCVAVDWTYNTEKCYLHQEVTGCNSVTETPAAVHHELHACKMSGELQAFFDEYHVRGGELKTEFKTRERCLAKCMQPNCMAADWNEEHKACYYHSDVTACNTLVKKPSCTHYKFIECEEPVRKVTDIFNSSRAEGGTPMPGASSSTDCIEFCGDDLDCHSVDYNVITHECIKHDIDGTCRPHITESDWYNFRLADCTDVIPGAKNFTGMHVPGASRIQKTYSADQCYSVCKYLIPDCSAADYDEDTHECYLHDSSTACEPLIAKASCQHFRLTECVPSVKGTYQNMMVPGGAEVDDVESEIDCYYQCILDPQCTAFEFNTLTTQCRIHRSKTGCNDLVDASSWAHHKLYECHAMPSTPITGVDFDSHLPHGQLVSDVLPGPVACVDKCLLAQTRGTECFGVDFNFETNECWFHNKTTVCNPTISKVGCAHYNLYDCENDRLPLTAKIFDYPGYRRMVEVGSPQALTLSLEECIETCAAHEPCLGVDYSETAPNGLTCQFHYSETACGVLIPDTNSTHYAFDDCKGQIVIAKGIMSDSTLAGGNVISVSSGKECISGCKGHCLAASYNPSSGACVRYNVTEACQMPVSSIGTTLYVFIDCSSTLGTALLSASYAGSRWAGGALSNDAQTKEACLEECADDGFCTAFSFNYRLGRCYLHTEVGCEPVIRSIDYQDFTLYIMKRAGCDTGEIIFANAYHGAHVKNGILAGQYTQSQCLMACSYDPACRAVDYNPVNFACWFHEADSCGNSINRDPRITHFVLRYC